MLTVAVTVAIALYMMLNVVLGFRRTKKLLAESRDDPRYGRSKDWIATYNLALAALEEGRDVQEDLLAAKIKGLKPPPPVVRASNDQMMQALYAGQQQQGLGNAYGLQLQQSLGQDINYLKQLNRQLGGQQDGRH